MVPVVIDGLAGLLVVLLLDTAVSQFSEFSATNAVILIVAFILMCVGVVIVRKLEARNAGGKLTVPLFLLDRRLQILSAVAFVFILVMMLAFQLGYLTTVFNIEAVGESETSAMFKTMSLLLLAIPFAYSPVLLRKMMPTIDVGNGRYPWLASFALLFINLMLLLTTAQFAAWIHLQDAVGDWLLGLIVFALLALIFGSPRWIYLSKQPDIGGDLSSLALWILCAWLIMS